MKNRSPIQTRERVRDHAMPTLNIEHLGQIREANLEFGDLTVLVGPQATGKSIALQLLKLMVDAGQVQGEMEKYGLDWSRKLPDFLDTYFGEGMHSIWNGEQTQIRWNGKSVNLEQIARHKRKAKEEKLFFIPAQRVLTLRDGWPRPFTDYSAGDPFAVREFSEKLRGLVETESASRSPKATARIRVDPLTRPCMEGCYFPAPYRAPTFFVNALCPP